LGTLLPTEAVLGREFQTSRNTVREALRRLVDEGLISRRQGAGSLVTSESPVARYVQSFESLDDLFANATNTHFVVNAIVPVKLDADIASRVGGAVREEWLLVSGVRWTERGGIPIAYVEAYIPARYRETVDTLWDVRVPFYAILEAASGRTILQVVQEIRAVAMPRRVANAFGLGEASLSLQLLRRYVTAAGTLITSLNWHRADQFTYRTQIARRVEGD
jgi:GntR family transcriptional regulator